MKAIFLFDYTGLVAQPWLAAGYECWSFDGQHEGHTLEGKHHKVQMWFDPYQTKKHVQDIIALVGKGVTFVFGFPPCDDLAVSGNAHLAKKFAVNPAFQAEATELARMVMYLGAQYNCKWGLENPVGALSTIWCKPNFYFHPHEYGGYLPEDDVHPQYPEYITPRDAYKKKTGIWCGNGFTKPTILDIGDQTGNYHIMKLGGKSIKTKNIRSATPRGFAIAMFKDNS